MEGQNREGPEFQVTGLVLLAALLGFVAANEVPFHAFRPRSQELWKAPKAGREMVEARLWQDPFAAVNHHLAELAHEGQARSNNWVSVQMHGTSVSGVRGGGYGNAPGDLSHAFAYGMHQIFGSTQENEVIVLAPMVFGASYAFEAEWRRKMRYAVVSALAVRGYEPLDGESIGYACLPLDAGDHDPPQTMFVSASADGVSRVEPNRQLPEIIPFEWFHNRSDATRPPVLLLWMRDEAFAEQPLTKICTFLDRFDEAARRLGGPKLDVKILGPSGSTNLKGMVEEGAELVQTSHSPCSKTRGEIYSYAATASDQRMGFHRKSSRDSSDANRLSKSRHSLRLVRTLRDDQALAQEVLRELRARGVDLTCTTKGERDDCLRDGIDARSDPYRGRRHHVALVAEWDTFYGRALRGAFVDQIKKEIGSADEPAWVHQFSYLRGLDGDLPSLRRSSDESKSDQRDESSNSEKRRKIERPVGRSQLDYLRRLADRIAAIDATLRNDHDASIRAIGVLGSDVYDKLVVLQALRPRFPNVLFFTTDLDANLFHPDELEFTRNLIVVSNFGLELQPALQKGIPPFRDSYQTSLFFSTQLALAFGNELPASANLQNLIQTWLRPRVFEIGRGGAVDLTADDELASSFNWPPSFGRTRIHPDRGPTLSRSRKLAAIVGVLIVICSMLVFYAGSGSIFESDIWAVVREQRLLSIGIGTGVAGLVVFVVTAMLLDDTGTYRGEPLSLMSGVSVWPTEIVRLLATLLALYFLFKCWSALRRSNKELTRWLFPDSGRSLLESARGRTVRRLWIEAQASPPASRLWARFWAFVSSLWVRSLDRHIPANGGTLDARDLWGDYLRQGAAWPTALRVTAGVVLFFAFGKVLIDLFGQPNVPARGDWARNVDTIVILVMTVPALLALIFTVLDTTRLCVRLCRVLSSATTSWPKETLRRYASAKRASGRSLSDWIDVQLIAKRSETVGRMIYYPFAVILLVIASRWRYFDNWDFPVGLAIVVMTSSALALINAVSLRRAAEQARIQAMDRLTESLMKSKGEASEDGNRAKQLELAIREVAHLNRGAFAPLRRHPLMQAGALLLTGIGWLLLEGRM